MNKIEITDPVHRAMLDQWRGMMQVASYASRAAKEFKVVGMTIMNDLIAGEVDKRGAEMKIKNITLAMKNGFDPDTESLLLAHEDGRFFLKTEPLDLMEQTEAQS